MRQSAIVIIDGAPPSNTYFWTQIPPLLFVIHKSSSIEQSATIRFEPTRALVPPRKIVYNALVQNLKEASIGMLLVIYMKGKPVWCANRELNARGTTAISCIAKNGKWYG
jgi:hypothetical protein